MSHPPFWSVASVSFSLYIAGVLGVRRLPMARGCPSGRGLPIYCHPYDVDQ